MAQARRQSSLVGEREANIEIKAPANKFFKLLERGPQNVPKATSDNSQGDFRKVGSICSRNYVIDGQTRVVKERIEILDPEKNLIATRVTDGDPTKEFKSFLTTIQATPKQRGPGSVVKCRMEYERIDDKVAHPENLLATFVKAAKEMDEMLMSEE